MNAHPTPYAPFGVLLSFGRRVNRGRPTEGRKNGDTGWPDRSFAGQVSIEVFFGDSTRDDRGNT